MSIVRQLLPDANIAEANSLINVGDKISKEKNSFISAEELKLTFGGEQFWNDRENLLDIRLTQIYVNGRQVLLAVKRIGSILAISVSALAKELRVEVLEDNAAGTLVYDKKIIPVQMINKENYILLNNIDAVFHGFVYWDKEKARIDIIFSYKEE